VEASRHPGADLVEPHAQEWEKTWAVFNHLTLFALFVFPVPVIPALVMWLIRRHESPYADDHGKEAVNFQITLVVYGVLCYLLSFVCVGLALGLVVAAFGYLFAVVAAVAAGKGRYYRYPMCLRFLG
jgi:uncharacterized Tic20 family protein